MKTIDYLKLQAKNLCRDFKTQETYFDNDLNQDCYMYTPKYFDVMLLIMDFDIDEGNFSLMKAQHIIAKLVGFNKWDDLISTNEMFLEMSRLLFENMHKISIEEWKWYVIDLEKENNRVLDVEELLDIFKTVFVGVEGHIYTGSNYILNHTMILNVDIDVPKKNNKKSILIKKFPLSKNHHNKISKVVNEKFDELLRLMEFENEELIKSKWDLDVYISDLFTDDVLPINLNEVISYAEAFLIDYLIDLEE